MNRLTYIKINGKDYPMCATTKALRDIYSRFGSIDNVSEQLQNSPPDEQITIVYWLLELLIDQGCEYQRVFEPEASIPQPLTADQLLVVVPLYEIEPTIRQVYETISAGIKTTVHSVPAGKQKKTKKRLPWQK